MTNLIGRTGNEDPTRVLEQLALDLVDSGEYPSLSEAVEFLESAMRTPIAAAGLERDDP